MRAIIEGRQTISASDVADMAGRLAVTMHLEDEYLQAYEYIIISVQRVKNPKATEEVTE